ncbi:hypothetical protein [uncultured Holdemanella sp.]|uniref:hypothetical protein n=1 Tax=uncultured Holdemanella sp. TaxID=1763549 RepID=UPI00258362DE|nr:hypothetical protein [uncultured Holdemanella sp.]
MKKLIISVISTVMMIGAGVAFKSNQDVSVPTVEKSSMETTNVEKKKSKVSKHEDVDKEKAKTDESQVKEENTSNKSDLKKESVSSSTKKQDTQSNDTSKSSVKSDTKVIDSSNNNSSTTNDSVQQTTSKEETVVEPVPAPETVQPSYACLGGINQNVSCDVILDSNFYYATYGSMSEAESVGEYYLNDVMYIGNTEITNYSVQPVYRNDHSIAYYGLNLWSNGSLIQ